MYYQTPAGLLHITMKDEKISEAVFVDRNDSVTHKTAQNIKPKFKLNGTPFQIKVWQATLQIPAGQTKTYQELAQSIGHPTAYRAVANALGANKIAYFIPCHRIIRNDGNLGGYKWGIERKAALLTYEGAKKPTKIN